MQTVLITGGTGMIGKQLTKHLSDKGYAIIILTRKMPVSKPVSSNVSYALWNIADQTMDVKALQKADYIIHLAGAGVVDKKWTAEYKQEIVTSRTRSSALLLHTLQNNNHQVKAFISASAIGWYGEDPAPDKEGFTENDLAAPGFLGDTCKLWEESVEPIEKLSIRLVKIRIGIVLSNEGGALAEFKKPIQVGIAGILANGNQLVSWIHIDDLCRAFIAGIENQQMNGTYNAVAPKPVTNETLTIELAKVLKGRFYIPLHVPKFILKIMLGDRSIEVLKSTTVNGEKIRDTGFAFLYPTITAAIAQLAKS